MAISLFDSTSYLTPAARESVAQELIARVHDGLAIEAAAKHAHWAARGPLREPIHAISDKVAKMGLSHAENNAELAQALGATVRGDASLSTLAPYPTGLIKAEDHALALHRMLKQYCERLFGTCNVATAVNDVVTANDIPALMKEVNALGWALNAQVQIAPQVLL